MYSNYSEWILDFPNEDTWVIAAALSLNPWDIMNSLNNLFQHNLPAAPYIYIFVKCSIQESGNNIHLMDKHISGYSEGQQGSDRCDANDT